MLRIDKSILDTSKVICDNITYFGKQERGILCQNILGHIRNFVEYVAIKSFSKGKDVDPHDYNNNVAALKDIQKHGKLRFLYKFHGLLQKSVSHYTLDKDGSERLMLKYYEYLIKIKLYLKHEFNLDVLENINDFPIDTDTELVEYYEKIASIIEHPSRHSYAATYNDRYYVQKIKPFFSNNKIYYEITLTAATANTSKFDRVIAFTRHEIMDNYAIKFSIHNDIINVLGKDMSILIIDGYEISIRQCEFDNLSKLFGKRVEHSTSSIEYKNLMKFLSDTKMSLTELVSSNQAYYGLIKKRVISEAKSIKIFNLLDKCRKVITRDKPGSNVLRYLLYKMNNRIIKCQYNNEECKSLSNLYLNYGCIPFDNMPYCSSLRQHNPKIFDLFNSITSTNHEHELLARYIKNNTEIEGKLFTHKNEIEVFENNSQLIKNYNDSLYYKHTGRMIEKYKDYYYIREYADDSASIIKSLQQLSSSGVSQYSASVDSWLSRKSYIIDDDEKKRALRQMFTNSHVALIYGSAGTGKTTFINHIANFWGEKNKIFLANTHPAVDNLRRKISSGNSKYSTIAKFLSNRNVDTDCDVLFIDECSTVSNSDMIQILKKATFKLLVLVGDVYQIESIYFGNWFSIARKFVPKTSVFELTHPYRTDSKDLITVWDRVRNLDDSILEILVKKNYVSRSNQSIFDRSSNDEIILCLNYDGLYGINNINHFLQNCNLNNGEKCIVWGIKEYNVGDPILFNESNRFSPLIHNNTKGKIVGIYPSDEHIRFDIELEESINEIDAMDYDFQLIGVSESGNSIISFFVNKFKNTDEDDDNNNSTIVPFQVAYAISIHKAQGLEYDSVKIVVTKETEEYITHNIFYTAITRTKNKLKIYWTPETEKFVFKQFKIKDFNIDAYLLAQLYSIKISDK